MLKTLEPAWQMTPENGAVTHSFKAFIRSSMVNRTRIYRKLLLWLALVPIIAVTPSFASTLPDFSALVEQEAGAVVKISVRTSVESPMSGGFPGCSPEQSPEQVCRVFDQDDLVLLRMRKYW